MCVYIYSCLSIYLFNIIYIYIYTCIYTCLFIIYVYIKKCIHTVHTKTICLAFSVCIMFRISLDHQLIVWLLIIYIWNSQWFCLILLQDEPSTLGRRFDLPCCHWTWQAKMPWTCHVHWDERHMIIRCAPLSPCDMWQVSTADIGRTTGIRRMREIMTHGFENHISNTHLIMTILTNHGSIENCNIFIYLIHSYPTINQLLHKVAAKTNALTIVNVPYAGPSPTLSWSDFMLLGPPSIYRCLIESNLIQLTISNNQACVLSFIQTSPHPSIHPSIHLGVSENRLNP